MSADAINLLGMPQGELEALFTEFGEKAYHARQLMRWVYQRGVTDFDAMTDLSKSLRQKLSEQTVIELPQVLSQHDSADGTVKWLFESGFGQAVEAVFIPEPDGPGRTRATAAIVSRSVSAPSIRSRFRIAGDSICVHPMVRPSRRSGRTAGWAVSSASSLGRSCARLPTASSVS